MPKDRAIMKNNRRRQATEPPFTAKVRDLISDGRGVVSREDGKTFFVAGAWPEETVVVSPTGTEGRVGVGVAAEVKKQVPHVDERPVITMVFRRLSVAGAHGLL